MQEDFNNKIIWLLNNKNLIEDYFKLKNLGSINQYKDIYSSNYKRLSIEDKKIIDALNYIDSISTSTSRLQINKGFDVMKWIYIYIYNIIDI